MNFNETKMNMHMHVYSKPLYSNVIKLMEEYQLRFGISFLFCYKLLETEWYLIPEMYLFAGSADKKELIYMLEELRI